MADVRSFSGFRFDSRRAPLGKALCPPYDVIDQAQARVLRRTSFNAVHLELPADGQACYKMAAQRWQTWRAQGMVINEKMPALYVCEETFRFDGGVRRRRGFFAALGVTERAARSIVRHERTLSKPKADRLRLLRAVRANISPIFGLFPDKNGVVRRALALATRQAPVAEGRTPAGISYRVWVLHDPTATARITRAMTAKNILIADGHHRYEVSRRYYEERPSSAAETVLAFLCPEEDAGLVALSTHRVLSDAGLRVRAQRLCRLVECASLIALLAKLKKSHNSYAFGVYEEGQYFLAEPNNAGGCRSRLCVEWLSTHLLGSVAPDRILYTPDAQRALKDARALAGAAVFVKPFAVEQIRRAVAAVGLLPPKSTYFFPKIATGLVFKSVELT